MADAISVIACQLVHPTMCWVFWIPAPISVCKDLVPYFGFLLLVWCDGGRSGFVLITSQSELLPISVAHSGSSV